MTSARPARPEIGARTWVNSRLSLASADGGLGRVHDGVALRDGRLAGVGLVAGDGVAGEQGLRARVLDLRQLGRAARAFQFGQRAVELVAVAAFVDHEQQVALVDLLAFLVGDALDIAADAGAQLDRFHRGDAAGELVPLAHRPGHHLGHADFRRRWRGLAGSLGAAGADCRDAQGSRT